MRSLTRFLSRKPPAPYALTAHRAISTPRFDTCTCNKSVRARQRERKRKKEREKETRNTKGGEKCVRFFDPVFSGQKKSTRITTNARMVGTTPVPIASRFDSELFASRRFTFSRRYEWCVCVRADTATLARKSVCRKVCAGCFTDRYGVSSPPKSLGSPSCDGSATCPTGRFGCSSGPSRPSAPGQAAAERTKDRAMKSTFWRLANSISSRSRAVSGSRSV